MRPITALAFTLTLAVAQAAVNAAPPERLPWDGSRMTGTPDPPLPFVVEPAFPRLTFAHPVRFGALPGTERVFVGQLEGKIVSFPNDPAQTQTDLMIDLAKSRPGMRQLYGMDFHPQFVANRYVYLCYVMGDNQPDGTRVSRFEVSRTDPPRILPETEKLLITWLSGGHNGGCLQFGPDGYLYISAGDAAVPSPPDPLDTGQDVSDLLSSILRIDVDHEDPGRAYRVPADNPFVDLPRTRPEIWAFGFRNPWRMSFDRKTGDLWVGDVGWELWEMVYRVVRGGNYGWSVMEGPQTARVESKRGPGPILPPTVAHPHSEAASVTGGYVYRGSKLKNLKATYVYGDFQTGKVWGLRLDDKKQVAWRQELANTPLQLVSFGEDQQGELYALDYERSQKVYHFVPNPAVGRKSAFPRTLGQTGLLASTKDHTLAPGVVPYSINAELWSDDALAERWLAIPGRGAIDWDPAGNGKLPEGSVLARTVSRELERGNPRSRRRVETQVLHFQDQIWRPYTYAWNDDQSDAALVEAQGGSRTFTIRDDRAPGGQRVQNHQLHARTECIQCHNPWVEKRGLDYGQPSASPNALTLAQLNRDRDGHSQLSHFEALGLIAKPLPATLPKQANPYDESANLNDRARSYLQVNCAHCHQFGAGGAALIALAGNLELSQTRTVGVRPIQGTFGIDHAQIIAPGDPDGSVLLYRIAKQGGGRMPRIGSEMVDERAVELIAAWIAGMPKRESVRGDESQHTRELLRAVSAPNGEPAARTRALQSLLGTTRGALALVQVVARLAESAPVRREAVALAKDHPSIEVRDLFERFVPDSERAQRLGDTIKPDALLALPADRERGQRLFFDNGAVQCKNCHRINGRGETLGPDLSKIGGKYSKRALIQEILEPSKSIEPQYVTYLLETKAGQIHSGLLVEKTGTEVVLKDARNQTLRVPAADVEQLVPQPKSLMPELLLREMTAQQAADLLEYLSSLK